MREIKFRAWDQDRKAMYDGNALIGPKPLPQVTLTTPSYYTVNEFFAQPRYAFMQFTGLKDKNGKDIYESDIVEISRAITDREGRKPIREVMNWVGGAILPWPHDEEFEVIGNIYENPELLTS